MIQVSEKNSPIPVPTKSRRRASLRSVPARRLPLGLSRALRSCQTNPNRLSPQRIQPERTHRQPAHDRVLEITSRRFHLT